MSVEGPGNCSETKAHKSQVPSRADCRIPPKTGQEVGSTGKYSAAASAAAATVEAVVVVVVVVVVATTAQTVLLFSRGLPNRLWAPTAVARNSDQAPFRTVKDCPIRRAMCPCAS